VACVRCLHAMQDVITATRMLPYLGGRTNTTAALRLLRDVVFQPANGDRVSARNVAILVANGESTLDSDQVRLTRYKTSLSIAQLVVMPMSSNYLLY